MSTLRPPAQAKKAGPVGLITRADTSLSERNVSLLQQWGHAAVEHIGSMPPAVREGARDVEVFARWAERNGGIERRHVQLWHTQVMAVRDQYERTIVELAAATANVQATTLTAGTPLSDLTRRGADQNRIYALRERAAQLRVVLERAERIAVNAPGWSPWQWGTPGVRGVQQHVFRAAGSPGAGGTGNIAAPGLAGLPSGALPGWGGIAERAGHLRIPPHARFWIWGGDPRTGAGGTPGSFVAGLARRGYGMVSQAAAAMRAYGAAWLFNLARTGMNTAEANEDALTAFAAERGMLQLGDEYEDDVHRRGRRRLAKRAGDPWWSEDLGLLERQGGVKNPVPLGTMAYKRRGVAATIELRTALEDIASNFYFTSGEMVSGMRALGPLYTPARMRAAAQLARRVGKSPAEIGAYYNRILTHLAEPVIMLRPQERHRAPLGINPGLERQANVGAEWKTDLWPDGAPKGPTTSFSLLNDINRAMHEAGMRDRPGQFMANVEALAAAMSPGVGLAHPHDAIGMAALFAEAGYGGEKWQDLMTRTIQAQGSRQGAAQTAAKIAAVRRFLGPTEIGGGAYGEKVNPGTLRGALRLIESGDPRVLRAFMSYAMSKAGGDEEWAKTIFQSMMGGFSTLDTERVWKLRKSLGRVRNAGQGWNAEEPSENHRPGRGTINGRPIAYLGPNEPWQEGPMMHGPGGREWKALAKEKAELDWVGYRIGTPMLGLAKDIKEAALIAEAGFMADPMDALLDAVQALPWSVRFAIAGMNLGRGTRGNAIAGLMVGGAEAVQGATRAYDWLQGLLGWRTTLAGAAARSAGGASGLGPADLQGIANQHLATVEDVTLALMAHSEAANRREAAAVMHTAFNRVDLGMAPDVQTAILGPGGITGPQGGARPYATSRMPDHAQMEDLLQVARNVRAARAQRRDPTGGAVGFMHPETQRRANARDPAHNLPPEDVDARWTGGGLERVEGEGVNNDRIWLYRPRRGR